MKGTRYEQEYLHYCLVCKITTLTIQVFTLTETTLFLANSFHSAYFSFDILAFPLD